MTKLKYALMGFMAALTAGTILATVPNPFPYSIRDDLPKRTIAEYQRVNAGATAATVTFAAVSKTLLVQNEGSQPARVSVAGATASTAAGVLIGGGASYSDPNWCTDSVSYIRSGSSDVSLTFQVTR